MTSNASRGLWARLCRLLKPDWMFGFLVLVGTGMLVSAVIDPADPITGTATAMTKLLIFFPMVIALSLLATFGAALDRRKVEDYHYQLMANAAIIAVITAVFSNMLSLIFADYLGLVSAESLVAILILSWGLGYFFYRIRGLNG